MANPRKQKRTSKKGEDDRHEMVLADVNKTEKDVMNVVRQPTKESSAHTKRKVGATEIKAAEIRITEGIGNSRGRKVGVSAIISVGAVTKETNAGRNTQH